MSIFDTLKSEDFDYKNVLDRFLGDDELYSFCLNDFLNDKSFADLKTAIVNKDYDNAFLLVHSLKGVGANLGLKKIYAYLCDLTEELRVKKINHLKEIIDKLDNEVLRIKEIIK